MNCEPDWLDIQSELYPQIFLSKLLHLECVTLGAPICYHVQVLYSSLHREINLTEVISEAVSNFFGTDKMLDIYAFDSEIQQFVQISQFPLKQPILLKGVFVEKERLVIKVEIVNNVKPNNKTEKTIKTILQKVAQWRKVHLESKKKITLEEAAQIVSIPRNTLDDYYFQLKLAEKHGFNFQDNFDQSFQVLRKFVKEKQEKNKEKASNPLPKVLSKYKNT